MGNILAALLGGAGSGLQSYGNSAQREQEQTRMQAQRMAEMQQQESARRRIMKEDDERADAARKLETVETTDLARALNIKLPQGVSVNRSNLGLVRDKNNANATLARDASRDAALASQRKATNLSSY